MARADARGASASASAAVVPGDAGAIAVALVTGERDAIAEATNESLRVSGLYHIISISGLHMVVVVGTVLVLVRGVLALVPGLALRRPIKKWAALAAVAAAALYLAAVGRGGRHHALLPDGRAGAGRRADRPRGAQPAHPGRRRAGGDGR